LLRARLEQPEKALEREVVLATTVEERRCWTACAIGASIALDFTWKLVTPS
jgi:hypothetical protein